jgi:hypothetical protein
MKFKIKGAWLAMLVPALALAAPAFAQVRPAGLSDSQEPGYTFRSRAIFGPPAGNFLGRPRRGEFWSALRVR